MACNPPYLLLTAAPQLQQDGTYTAPCSWLHPDPLPDYFTIWIYDATVGQWIVQAAFQEVTGGPNTTRLAALVGLPPARSIRWWVQSICFGGTETSAFAEGPVVQTPGLPSCNPPIIPAGSLGAGFTVQADGFLTKRAQFISPDPPADHFLISIFDDTHGTTIVSQFPLFFGTLLPGTVVSIFLQGLPLNASISWFLAAVCPGVDIPAEAQGRPFITPGRFTELNLGSMIQQADGFYTQNATIRVPLLSPDAIVYDIWTQDGPILTGFDVGGPFNVGQLMPIQLVGLPPGSQVSWRVSARYINQLDPQQDLISDGPVFNTPAAVGIVKHRGESFGANLGFNYQGRQTTLNLSMIAVHHGSGNTPGTTVFLDVPDSGSPQPFQRALSIAISNELPVGIYDALVRISEVGGSVLYETTFPNTWEVI